MDDYSRNCDWVRERFNLGNNTSIYQIVNTLTEHVKKNDLIGQKENEQCQTMKQRNKSSLTKQK